MMAPQASSRALESVLDNLDREEPAALDRLFRLLAIPSISTDPAFHEACIEAAEACADALRDIGFEARVEPTLGKNGRWAPACAAGKARTAARPVLRPLRRAAAGSSARMEGAAFEPRLVNDPPHGKIVVPVARQ